MDNTSYINKYVTNYTNGIIFSLSYDNEYPVVETLRFFCIRNMIVSIPTVYYIGYIGYNFLCVISRDCDMR